MSVDHVSVLLAEYSTLRAEILTRSNHMYQVLIFGGTVLAVIFSFKDLNTTFWIVLTSVVAIIATFSAFIGHDTKKASARIRQIERQINDLAGDTLLVWETQWGGPLTPSQDRLSSQPQPARDGSRDFTTSLDPRLALKVATFDAIGMANAIVVPMIVDPLLKTQVQYGARVYPVGRWWLLLLCPVLFAITYACLRTFRSSFAISMSAWVFLMATGLIVAFVGFRPETPHMWVVESTFAYSALAFCAVMPRLASGQQSYLADQSLPLTLRVERLRATITFWQLIAIGGTLAYLVFAYIDLSTVWNTIHTLVPNAAEQVLLENASLCSIFVYSALVVIGPLKEAFQVTFELTSLLTSAAP